MAQVNVIGRITADLELKTSEKATRMYALILPRISAAVRPCIHNIFRFAHGVRMPTG